MEEPQTPSRLTNDDFRKLLMTPRSSSSSSHAPGSIREAMAKSSSGVIKLDMPPPSERHEARRKKKNFYAQLKKQEDTKLQELAEKYRDRARERRDGSTQDYQPIDPTTGANAYRAVAPDSKSGLDAAERRRQLIQESKFLGGDMEHTHLVKGLDYALLHKVRSEIIEKEKEQEFEMEKLAEMAEQKENEIKDGERSGKEEPEHRTIMGRNIFNTIQFYRSRNVERNELYAPGRMAYSYDVTETVDEVESDIPTTLIRSKADVPQNEEDLHTLTTNDIVINKLAQILLYLRQGGKGKKNKRRDKDKPLLQDEDQAEAPDNERNRSSRDNKSSKKSNDLSIYDDIDEYRPSRRDDGASSSKHRNRNYFDKSSEQEEREAGGITVPPPPKINSNLISKLSTQVEGYAECYPGLQEMNDAIDDSDDEVDYTKMDLGNKKGPIGRWDFDTQEEYSDYMSSKEALPKAAFQYGVKMQDGRKTRKNKTEKNEKAELDREWQKIQSIIHKRKNKEGGSSRDDEPEYKVPKY
ncbi:protein Red [Contarinia nasturtii]|uniref:protein Red n=1 Tax=Contarinia nasturtii TaxID=265458 RepID=UPI0012D43FD9|nr:protein Red [Contarinia nasturtii]